MEILRLVRDFGIPVGLLLAAVVTLWRAWRLECRLRDQYLAERYKRLAAREGELYSLYRELALRKLARLVRARERALKGGKDERDSSSS